MTADTSFEEAVGKGQCQAHWLLIHPLRKRLFEVNPAFALSRGDDRAEASPSNGQYSESSRVTEYVVA